MYYVYVLRSIAHVKELYIGSTNDLRSRFRAHDDGKSVSTKRYLPWRLIYYEAYETEALARMREKRLKHHGSAKHELMKRALPSPSFFTQPQFSKTGAGFTLMELLIVIAIIGILISISAAAYTTAQKKSRDSRRQSDVKALQSALEQYYAANDGSYPGGTYPNLTVLDASYLPSGEPKDPKTGCSYEDVSWDSATYKVCADLEGVGAFPCTSATCSSCTPERDFCVNALQ